MELSMIRIALASVAAFVAGAIGLIAAIWLTATLAPNSGAGFGPAVVVGFFGPAVAVAAVVLKWGRTTPVLPAAIPMPAQSGGLQATEQTSEARHDESGFAAACAALKPAGNADKRGLLIGAFLIVAFFLYERGNTSATDVLMLMAVLFFHELGHLIAMRVLGFRDVKIFFLPGFGALTSGRKEAAPAWQHAVVSLMGPLPGILLAAAIFASGRTHGAPLLSHLAWILLIINALNLAPVVPLDGGKFILRSLFSRTPMAAVVFSTATSVLLAIVALKFQLYLLAAVAFFGVTGVTRAAAEVKAAREVRARHPQVSVAIDSAPPAYLEDLYRQVAAGVLEGPHAAKVRAARMQSLHELVAAPAASGTATAVLVCVYLSAIIAAFMTGVLGALVR